MLHTPNFWYQRSPGGDLAAFALTPLSWLWRGAGFSLRHRAYPISLPIPIICIGNLTVGGTGKTPLAQAAAAAARRYNLRPVILTRGYGGKIKTPHLVSGEENVSEVGDEALLLCRHNQVVVARRRDDGARMIAQRNLGDLIIMDDGFQNPSLRPDRSILVFNGAVGVGNGKVIPSGPLRETLARGTRRATIALIVGDDQTSVSAMIKSANPSIMIFSARREFDDSSKKLVKNKAVIAFAGIGYPEKFSADITAAGGRLIESFTFPDHHMYSESEIEMLKARAAANDALLVTTAKDDIRLAHLPHGDIRVLTESFTFEDGLFDSLIADINPSSSLGKNS